MWSKDRQRQSTIYIQTKIVKSLSQKNENENENNFTQMSNHIPFLHTYVHKKKGGKIKYMFSKLIDGVHPTIDLSRSWF
jgi:hypothetical protein